MPHDRFTPTLVQRCAIVACGLALAACVTRTPAPVEERRAPPPVARVPGVAPAVPPPVAAPAQRVPDAEPAATYTVKRGDTLAGIALEHGLDYRELAMWNGIDNPNRILVGQVLRLAPPGEAPASGDVAGGVVTTPLRTAPPVVESRAAPPPVPSPGAPAVPRNTDTLKVAPKAVREAYSEALVREMAKAPESAPVVRAEVPKPATAPAPAAPPAAGTPQVAAAPPQSAPPAASSAPSPALAEDEDLDWMWPAKGKIVTGFSDTANLKGIDIAGTMGQPILASAAGRVVYAGSGLRGYGKLVIIKHNAKFLTAYAHNREILVKEGQQVARGQRIAEMGNTDADQVKLHFEIRRLGKPMDPLKYLPPG